MLTQVVVAPRGAVPANDVDFAIRMAQLRQKIVEQIELFDVVVLHVTGAVIAKKVVKLRHPIRLILIANSVNHIDMFAGVQVIKAQPVTGGAGNGIVRAAWQDYQQTKAKE
jgi:hypothetical protein